MRAGLFAVTLLAFPTPGVAQEARVETRVEENFRREAQGQILARIEAGTALAARTEDGPWTEAALDGWVWTASLQETTREGFDLVVSAAGGENLRAAPSGQVLARLEEGTLLEELGREPGWTHVRRTGWIWTASVRATAAAVAGGGEAPSSDEPDGVQGVAGGTGPTIQDRFVRLAAGTPVLSAPGGDTVARADPGADVEVVARDGSWVRVRVEGWAWMPEGQDELDSGSGDDEGELTPDALLAGGDEHVGRGVVWTLQFISLERAEAVRTDFFEGEPFLLGRYGGREGPFVYVAVPPGRLAEVEGLSPLEMVTVTGRVRTASSALTGTPIIDLVDIRRGARR